jgi:transposase
MLLQVLYSIRLQRQIIEQTRYNLLLRWFIGLSMDDAVWVPTVFTKNCKRLIIEISIKDDNRFFSAASHAAIALFKLSLISRCQTGL